MIKLCDKFEQIGTIRVELLMISQIFAVIVSTLTFDLERLLRVQFYAIFERNRIFGRVIDDLANFSSIFQGGRSCRYEISELGGATYIKFGIQVEQSFVASNAVFRF